MGNRRVLSHSRELVEKQDNRPKVETKRVVKHQRTKEERNKETCGQVR